MIPGGYPPKEGDYIFGFPDEWAKFQERFPTFLKAFDSLAETLNKARVRTFTPRSRADQIVFFLGSLICEDFTEVWLMAGNGLGTGALKVLRGMYERAVTAAYISQFPAEAECFWKFWPIPHRKLLNHAKELHGVAFLESALGTNHIGEVEQEYQKVKNEFASTFSWSPLSLPDMAKRAGFGLENCYYDGYATPTQQAHSTVLALTSRLKRQPDGWFFDNSIQWTYAGLAIRTAHVVILKMLRVENFFFSLGLESEVSQREAECKTAWPGIENECGKGM